MGQLLDDKNFAHGGARPGAGRKSIAVHKKKLIQSFSLDPSVIEKLHFLSESKKISKSAFISDLIETEFNQKK